MKYLLALLLLIPLALAAPEPLTPNSATNIVSGSVIFGPSTVFLVDGLLPGFTYELRFVGEETITFAAITPERVKKQVRRFQTPAGNYTGYFAVVKLDPEQELARSAVVSFVR